MRRLKEVILFLSVAAGVVSSYGQSPEGRTVIDFDSGWHFFKGDFNGMTDAISRKAGWQSVMLPHDWSIEGPFSANNPATNQGGALPGGIGWYKKIFSLLREDTAKQISVMFDGIYRNSEVWINGHYLGRRPYGYISFAYDITPYVHFGGKDTIVVRVDNSQQPNSRWYTGSGINRNVWLIKKNDAAIAQWGTFVQTKNTGNNQYEVHEEVKINNKSNNSPRAVLISIIYDRHDKEIARDTTFGPLSDTVKVLCITVPVSSPDLWSPHNPALYKIRNELYVSGKLRDVVLTPFGFRSFRFDSKKGFFLNGQHLKILGVCMHEDAGALGAVVNRSCIERQLKLLKAMGCNAIRTAHNPPAPEFLDICDSMGFLVLDEAFDMWKKKKTKYDYSRDFAQWHIRDLQDMILRDRNHPSIFMWSIGNEIREQFDSSGVALTREMTGVVKNLDSSRPVTSALTETNPDKNYIAKANALDVLSFNYKPQDYPLLPGRFRGQKFLATETAAAYETRGVYDMPADSVRYWPQNVKDKYVKDGNKDFSTSSYGNEVPAWGNTHEDAWRAVKNADYISGLFVWSGFSYLGEPAPYPYPARSSYFGLIDLAGFPKDIYYMYQSQWTTKPVLHLLPHWNWKAGQIVDVWAYYSQADEVELYLNGKSLGVRRKPGNALHVSWSVPFTPGTLRVVSRKNGKIVLVREIHTAGKPYGIRLSADKKAVSGQKRTLCFITAEIVDKAGNIVPYAESLIQFKIDGPGVITGLDNGYEADTTSFRGKRHKAWKGLCLAIIRSAGKGGIIDVVASSAGLKPAEIRLRSETE